MNDDLRRHLKGTLEIPDRSKKQASDKKPVWFITGCSTGFPKEELVGAA